MPRHPLRPLALLAILLAALMLAPRPARAEQKPPNVIVVLADDLGWGDLGCYGSRAIATPNLDRMATEGTRFTDFYASANVCTPSRAGLLTGRYSRRMGLSVGVLFPGSPNGLPPEESTIASTLKGAGYRTMCVGKWHLGNKPEFWPTRHGFDSYFGLPYSNDMTPLPLYRNDEKIEEPADQDTITRRYVEESVKFIDESKGAPFFLYLAHSMPHIPFHASTKFRGRSKAGLYGDAVEEIDWGMGEILEALRRAGVEKNTLVVFTSDNGPWFEGSAGAFRQRKGESWEGGTRVPGVAWWPGRVPAGRVCDVPVCNLDLLPTIAAITGAKLKEGRALDGRDYSGLFLGGAPPADAAERPIFFFNNDQLAAVRSGAWKLVVQTRYINANVNLRGHNFYKPGMLFDLANDPAENFDRAKDHPEIAQKLLKLIDDMEASLKADSPPAPKGPPPKEAD